MLDDKDGGREALIAKDLECHGQIGLVATGGSPESIGRGRDDDSGRRVCGMRVDELVWLVIFCLTGIGLGMSFEFMELHSSKHKPAADKSFFLCLIGYWSQTVLGGLYALWAADWNMQRAMRGAWTKPVLIVLVISALFDGAAQALDYVGQVQGGYMLFTIFHATVTFWSCLIAYFLLRARISPQQWVGVVLIACGVFVTSFPNPIKVPEGGSFFWGLVCSVVGSACLAASYPYSELVFKRGERDPTGKGAISEEMACCIGSAINSVIYTVYTLAYTAPRWKEDVTDYAKPGQSGYMVGGYCLYGFMVALHSLSFWMSVNKLGTVPTAVAKGAQQAGIFVFSHIIYCKIDQSECMDYNYGDSPWNKAQKGVAFLLCIVGCALYALSKRQ